MHFGHPPGFAVGERDKVQAAVAEGEGQGGACAIEADGDHEGVEAALGAAGSQQELGD